MNYVLTAHALESLTKRKNIRLDWLERVIECPQLIQADPLDSELEHRLDQIEESEGRVLRVIVNPNVDPIRVITAFFDCGKGQSMKLSIDEVADALHLQLVDADVIESEEVAPGIIVDYDVTGDIVGLEILRLSKRPHPVDVLDFQFQAHRKAKETDAFQRDVSA